MKKLFLTIGLLLSLSVQGFTQGSPIGVIRNLDFTPTGVGAIQGDWQFNGTVNIGSLDVGTDGLVIKDTVTPDAPGIRFDRDGTTSKHDAFLQFSAGDMYLYMENNSTNDLLRLRHFFGRAGYAHFSTNETVGAKISLIDSTHSTVVTRAWTIQNLDGLFQIGSGSSHVGTPSETYFSIDSTARTTIFHGLDGAAAIDDDIYHPLRVQKRASGTPSAGIAVGIAFNVETTDSNFEDGVLLEARPTTLTAGSEDFDFVVRTMASGAAAAERMRVTSAGRTGFGTPTPTGFITADGNKISVNLLELINDNNGAIGDSSMAVGPTGGIGIKTTPTSPWGINIIGTSSIRFTPSGTPGTTPGGSIRVLESGGFTSATFGDKDGSRLFGFGVGGSIDGDIAWDAGQSLNADFSNAEWYLDSSNGFMGVGTPNPIAALSMGNDDLIARDVNAGITASTTQTQGNGALTAEINEVATVANTNDTVTLPTAVAGLKITIINNGANTLQIFPASGDDLGAGVDTATTLASGSNVVFSAYDATNWETL